MDYFITDNHLDACAIHGALIESSRGGIVFCSGDATILGRLAVLPTVGSDIIRTLCGCGGIIPFNANMLGCLCYTDLTTKLSIAKVFTTTQISTDIIIGDKIVYGLVFKYDQKTIDSIIILAKMIPGVIDKAILTEIKKRVFTNDKWIIDSIYIERNDYTDRPDDF